MKQKLKDQIVNLEDGNLLVFKELEHLKVNVIVVPVKQTVKPPLQKHDVVVFFIKGKGSIIVSNKNYDTLIKVKKGSVVMIPKGSYHEIINKSDNDLEFVIVTNKLKADDIHGKAKR